MARLVKWGAILAVAFAVATVFAPSFWSVSHQQSLTNVLLGEFAAIAMGYTAFRIAYGKDLVRSVALGGVLCGAAIAVSPLVFDSAGWFTSVNVVGGGFIAVVAIIALVTSFVRGTDRNSHGMSRRREATDEPVETA